MPSPIKKVALAGATGAVGAPTLKELLDQGYEVTVLGRAGGSYNFPSSVKVTQVDYDSSKSLTDALTGQDALISTLATTSVPQQRQLVDASIAAGIKRFIPSEFGCDLDLPFARKMPVYGGKVAIEDYLAQKCTDSSTMSYTLVFNNAFFDWGMAHGFLGLNVKEKKVEFLDGGKVTFTTTPLAFIAKGTVNVLSHLDETKNRGIRLHGAGVTQQQLFEIAQDAVGKDGWSVSHSQTADMEREAWENFKNHPENPMGYVLGHLKRCAFGDGCGGDFTKKNDNAVLGLKELSKSEIADVVKSVA